MNRQTTLLGISNRKVPCASQPRGRRMRGRVHAVSGAKSVGSNHSAPPKSVEPPVKPAAPNILDQHSFQSDRTAAAWEAETLPADPEQRRASMLRGLQALAGKAAGDPMAAAYIVYHFNRTAYYTAQAAAVAVAMDPWTVFEPVRIYKLLDPNGEIDIPLDTTVHDMLMTLTTELSWIQQGVYKMPRQMLSPGIPENNPLLASIMALQQIEETVKQLDRGLATNGAATDRTWLKGPMYPQYYTRTFHNQTDGRFSGQSAQLHRHGREISFNGRTDPLQRTALVPISEYINASGKPMSEMKLLDVGSCHGHFHTYIKDNWPELRTILSDLSPFYLEKARANIREWKQARQPRSRLGGVDDAGVEYLQTAAENLSLQDESVDVVLSVFVMHELPPSIFRRAVHEMFRVLKPGGLCVMCDGLQFGDKPYMDSGLELLTGLGEPYYRHYARQDLGELFGAAGFVPGTRYLNGYAKVVSFTKP